MTALAFNQSLSMLTTSTSVSTVSPIPMILTYPLNLFSAYIIAPTSATLSSVYAIIDRSLLASGINVLPFRTGTMIGEESLGVRQNGSSNYSWNATIVEGTSTDTSEMAEWLSYSGASGIKGADSVEKYSRVLSELNDAITLDREAWNEIPVPKTEALPSVAGEPTV
jgi:hypothetical protein